MSTDVVMPQMGESIAEGTITRWLKKIGEHVERDEPLFEISTDKVDAEIPSPVAGVLREIRHKEGDTVAVNEVVAVLADESEAGAPSVPQEAQASPQEAQPQQPLPAVTTEAEMNAQPAPPLPPPQVQQEQFAAPPAQQAVSAPAVEAVGATVQKQTATQPSATQTQTGSVSNSAAQAGGNGSGSSVGEMTAEELRRTRSSPLVRNIAKEHGVDISQLEGSGMSGRVTKSDILNYIGRGAPTHQAATQAAPQTTGGAQVAPQQSATAQQTAYAPQTQMPPQGFEATQQQFVSQPQVPASQSQPPQQVQQQFALAPQSQQMASSMLQVQPAQGDRVEPMSVMRRKIAEHMVMSKTVSAHVTTVYEIDMTRVAKLREENKRAFQERHGTKLTFMPFIFQAVTNAIRKYPTFNAQIAGDQVIYKRDINLGMAVALDWGLIVPVIKRADDLSIGGLARTANDLAERARAKQLKPDEVAGGTFTITNPGVFGGLFGTPIINQPQVAILAVGAIEKRPKVITTPEGDDFIAIRQMAYFALSYDHRLIDGADAERFLSFVKEQLEAGQFSL